MAEPFRLSVAEALGMPVEIVSFRDYPALVDSATRSRVEYAVLSAGAFSAAEAMCECLEPLVVSRAGDGTDSYRMVLIAPTTRTGGLTGFAGSRIGFVEPAAEGGIAGGNWIASREMAAAGLDIAAGQASRIVFGNSAEATAALEKGEIDALVGWSSMTGDPSEGYSRGTLRRLAALGGDPRQWRVAWESTLIPHRVHAVPAKLPPEAKSALRNRLADLFNADPVAYDAIEPAFGGGFIAARPSQFRAMIDLLRSAGIGAGEGG